MKTSIDTAGPGTAGSGTSRIGRVAMGTIWDDTVAVLGDRAGEFAAVAAIGLVLPVLVQAAVASFANGWSGVAILAGLLSLAVTVITLWAQLAIIAVSLSSATTRRNAFAAAGARLPAAILVGIVLVLALFVLFAPVWIALVVGGYDLSAAAAAMQVGGPPPPMPAGVGAFVGLYMLAFSLALLWIGARLFVAMPVALAERRGVGAIGRSFRLTRGMALRIAGVLVLYLIVFLVALKAAQFVFGTIFALVLGSNVALAQFLTAIVIAIVSAGGTVIANVFGARLYAALADRSAGRDADERLDQFPE